MANNKILTLSELADYCKKNRLFSFDGKDGKSVICRYDATATFSDESDDDQDESNNGIYYTNVRVCHTGVNLNHSSISEDVMKAAIPSLKDRPVLAYIHQLDDGSWDFFGHNVIIIQDEDGNQVCTYQEKQVGSFTDDEPVLQYDAEADKTYLCAKIAIPEDYTMAADIIRAKNGETQVSCEILIDNFEFDAKNNLLTINNFIFTALTLLGRDDDGNQVMAGMEGSKTYIDDNKEKNEFSKKSSGKEVGQQMLNDLLKKYNVTVDDLDFEYEGLSDEELEQKFKEKFESAEPASDPESNVPTNDDEGAIKGTNELHNNEPDNGANDKNAPLKYSVNFELSYDDIRSAIYRHLDQMDRANSWETSNYIAAVYDNRFVYFDWNTPTEYYAQNYTKNTDDTLTFDGEPYRVFPMYVTEDEKNSLDTMRSEYSELKTFKEQADAKELNAKKDEILNNEAYSVLADNKDFAELKEHKSEFAVDELQNKADLIFAAYVKSVGNFSLNNNDGVNAKNNMPNAVHFNVNDNNSSAKDDPYPGLFKEESN